MDADPYLAQIFYTYKFGLANISFDNLELATPAMTWIGVNLSLLIPLTDSDI